MENDPQYPSFLRRKTAPGILGLYGTVRTADLPSDRASLFGQDPNKNTQRKDARIPVLQRLHPSMGYRTCLKGEGIIIFTAERVPESRIYQTMPLSLQRRFLRDGAREIRIRDAGDIEKI